MVAIEVPLPPTVLPTAPPTKLALVTPAPELPQIHLRSPQTCRRHKDDLGPAEEKSTFFTFEVEWVAQLTLEITALLVYTTKWQTHLFTI